MSEATIIWLVNLGLSLPELAMRIQKLFMVANPTQADWDEVWAIMQKTPQQYLNEARERLALNTAAVPSQPPQVSPVSP